MKQLSFSTLIPALFGITEPTIYGVTMKLKKPFYASLIGGAVGGAIFGSLAVKATAFTVPGIMSIPTYIINDTNNLLYALLGIASSFVVAFIVTIILGFNEDIDTNQTKPHESKSVLSDDNKSDTPVEIYAPVTGKIRSRFNLCKRACWKRGSYCSRI